ncbi:FepA family TonB-dependent siderophore receptor [Celeribacter persicus]|uniref:Ferric enterobactin receptor n=1 Tax=Celeribacter persicus TaxID=1651082 RepID=A0A2T5H468_9RHOB|nr:FepA family TonB-dependent siderophore receptor [Celeribacter persicus]PTQ66360.1 ferric enterobactin receptor [Celeribacter persicus]
MRKGGYALRAGTALGLLLSLNVASGFAQDTGADDVIVLDPIVISSYEEEVLQSLGVSVISSEEISERAVANDISEIVRKMPGVNLTGASSSGQRGNQRQIDIRGMGPENVLILIDGKPVLSRTAIKMGRGGERDTRGDSNWVPAEMIERIEVIRGPAAARYGSGAAGGVVNIITKQPEDETFNINLRYNQPESNLEGGDARVNFLWAKPLNENVTLRLTGNYNKSEADDPDINDDTQDCDASTSAEDCASPAGVEGVVNKDLTAALDWRPNADNKFVFELGYSRQGNIYTADSQLSRETDTTLSLVGEETNTVKRANASISHEGRYAWGDIDSYIQYEHTDNRRLSEGTAGGVEGTINTTTEYDESKLDVLSAKSEADIETKFFGKDMALTVGTEFRYEKLDMSEISFSSVALDIGDTSADSSENDLTPDQSTLGLYAEGNILATDRLTISPAIRLDVADTFGTNLSGGLNATYEFDSGWSVKGGVGRAFKAPNLYQLSEGYVYTTRGNGCPYPYKGDGPCYVLGNSDLDAETSWNKEIGFAYAGAEGINATLTYFHNDYKDKIQSGTTQVGTYTVGSSTYRVYQWENIPDSETSGLEGSFQAPLGDRLNMSVNATYMLTSKQTLHIDGGTTSGGVAYDAITVEAPLSLVPDYTINASFEWQATDRLTVIPALTHYGEVDVTDYSAHTGEATGDTETVDPYTLVDLSLKYELNDTVTLTGGVTNLFDTSIKRSGNGSQTYNEPGRAFYVGLSATF